MRTGAFAPPQRGLWPQWSRVHASLILLSLVGLLAGPARAGGGEQPWPMAGHDVRRTGNESGGGSGVPRQIPPALLPTDTGLSLAGRNPSAGEIAIRYRVPGRTRVELQIYDIQGRMVRTLVPGGEQERGVYAEVWDGRTDAGHLASSGIYFVQARIGPTRLTKKVVLSR